MCVPKSKGSYVCCSRKPNNIGVFVFRCWFIFKHRSRTGVLFELFATTWVTTCRHALQVAIGWFYALLCLFSTASFSTALFSMSKPRTYIGWVCCHLMARGKVTWILQQGLRINDVVLSFSLLWNMYSHGMRLCRHNELRRSVARSQIPLGNGQLWKPFSAFTNCIYFI